LFVKKSRASAHSYLKGPSSLAEMTEMNMLFKSRFTRRLAQENVLTYMLSLGSPASIVDDRTQDDLQRMRRTMESLHGERNEYRIS